MTGVVWTLYGLLAAGTVWIVLVPITLARVFLRRAPAGELAERLGRVADLTPGPAAPRVVVHAISAGEVAAAAGVIEALQRTRPAWAVTVTCGTRDGRLRAEQLRGRFPAVDQVCYLPWDRARAVARWLHHCQPSAVVVVEPEFWPNLYRACGRLAIPLVVVNARVYPRDVRRYRLIRGFMRHALAVPDTFCARTAADVADLVAIGAPRARITVTGDLKVDAAAQANADPAAADADREGHPGPLLVAGSTHPLEEEIVLRAFGRVREAHPALRLIVAPRHVRRAARVERLCRAMGYRARRSSCDPAAATAWDVLIIDRVGMLAAWYRASDVAFVGGSLIRHGGHNVLEPAAARRATLVGPHVDHVRHHVDALERAGGIVRLRDARPETLAAELEAVLRDSRRRAELGARAHEYVRQHAGAADRCVELVLRAAGRSPAAPATWPRAASAAASPAPAGALLRDRGRS
jgi:3-deoxy-D-manno-octulosonic-acid transferase